VSIAAAVIAGVDLPRAASMRRRRASVDPVSLRRLRVGATAAARMELRPARMAEIM
jgi:hypothetical protein